MQQLIPNLPLSSLGTKDNIWNLYRTDEVYLHEKTFKIPNMRRLCFEVIHNGRMATLGVYEYNSVEVLKAWGYKDDEHCSYHMIKTNSEWSEVIEGCPDFKVLKDELEEVTGFSLSYKKIHTWEKGSYYEEEIPKTCCTPKVQSNTCHIIDKEPIKISFIQKLDLYAPLIFTILFSFAIGGFLTSFGIFTLGVYLMNSMGVFITMLGLLKLRDIKKFASMFIQYDPLAKKFPLYAKIYPYLETGVGGLILLSLFIIQIQLVVVLMYTCTTIGIISSLNSGKKLECGCLGGKIKLPLSKVTILENITMIVMALFMIYSHVFHVGYTMPM